jgi:hypothetical protein
MWSPEDAAKPAAPQPAKPPGDELPMVPLHGEDVRTPIKGGATSFFALPAARRKDPVGGETEPQKRSDGVGAPSPGPAGPPPGAPGGGYVPMGAVPSAPMMMPMGISGPVASGGPTGMPLSVPPPPDYEQDVQRARSYRVFAVVMMLMAMVFTVMVAAVFLIFSAVVYQGVGDSKNDPVAVIGPITQPVNAPVDTGAVAPPIPNPEPRPSRPRPDPGPRPDPAPRPAPPTGNAPLTVKLEPGAPLFTSIEVVCETPSGKYRERAPFSSGTAVRADVPRSDCTMYFKGGPPANVRVSGGQTLSCSFVGSSPNCK